jgi:hypothetical protein
MCSDAHWSWHPDAVKQGKLLLRFRTQTHLAAMLLLQRKLLLLLY